MDRVRTALVGPTAEDHQADIELHAGHLMNDPAYAPWEFKVRDTLGCGSFGCVLLVTRNVPRGERAEVLAVKVQPLLNDAHEKLVVHEIVHSIDSADVPNSIAARARARGGNHNDFIIPARAFYVTRNAVGGAREPPHLRPRDVVQPAMSHIGYVYTYMQPILCTTQYACGTMQSVSAHTVGPLEHFKGDHRMRKVAIRAARALEQLHGAGFVHRDITAENMMATSLNILSPERDLDRSLGVKFIDFGRSVDVQAPRGEFADPSHIVGNAYTLHPRALEMKVRMDTALDDDERRELMREAGSKAHLAEVDVVGLALSIASCYMPKRAMYDLALVRMDDYEVPGDAYMVAVGVDPNGKVSWLNIHEAFSGSGDGFNHVGVYRELVGRARSLYARNLQHMGSDVWDFLAGLLGSPDRPHTTVLHLLAYLLEHETPTRERTSSRRVLSFGGTAPPGSSGPGWTVRTPPRGPPVPWKPVRRRNPFARDSPPGPAPDEGSAATVPEISEIPDRDSIGGVETADLDALFEEFERSENAKIEVRVELDPLPPADMGAWSMETPPGPDADMRDAQ